MYEGGKGAGAVVAGVVLPNTGGKPNTNCNCGNQYCCGRSDCYFQQLYVLQ